MAHFLGKPVVSRKHRSLLDMLDWDETAHPRRVIRLYFNSKAYNHKVSGRKYYQWLASR